MWACNICRDKTVAWRPRSFEYKNTYKTIMYAWWYADINKEIDQNNRWPHQWVFSKVLSFKKTCRAEIYKARKKIITPGWNWSMEEHYSRGKIRAVHRDNEGLNYAYNCGRRSRSAATLAPCKTAWCRIHRGLKSVSASLVKPREHHSLRTGRLGLNSSSKSGKTVGKTPPTQRHTQTPHSVLYFSKRTARGESRVGGYGTRGKTHLLQVLPSARNKWKKRRGMISQRSSWRQTWRTKWMTDRTRIALFRPLLQCELYKTVSDSIIEVCKATIFAVR